MGKTWNTLKDAISAKSLKYSDNFIKFKGNAKITEDSFAFDSYPAMHGAIDIKTNNYSNLILSKNQLNSEWVDLDIKDFDYRNGLVTTLSFFSYNEDLNDTPYYLYFDKNYEFWDLYIKHAPYSLVPGEIGEIHSNFTFYIEFLDDIKCKIRHWFGDLIFYLAVDSEKTIQFVANRDESSDFLYNIDDTRMLLYKKLTYTQKEQEEYKKDKEQDIKSLYENGYKLYDYVRYCLTEEVKTEITRSSSIETSKYILNESFIKIENGSKHGAITIKDIEDNKLFDVEIDDDKNYVIDGNKCIASNPESILVINADNTSYRYYVDFKVYKTIQNETPKYYRDVIILAASENLENNKIIFAKAIEIDASEFKTNEFASDDTELNSWVKNYIISTRHNTFASTEISSNIISIENSTSIIANRDVEKTKVFKIKAIVDEATGNATLGLDENIEASDDSIISIKNSSIINYNPNSSYIKYDRSESVDSIDTYYSQFNLKNQVLFHHEYNTDNSINFIPLKNHLTYKGSSIRGNNTTISSLKYADVNFRKYNAINSGYNQELGYDNITLTYTFEDQEYIVNPGEDLFIYIPDENQEIGFYPLYPYRQINLADTKFIKNGAFGSDTPFFADKIKKIQGKTSLTTEKYKVVDNKLIISKTDNPAYENSGTYLCTWLYQKDFESEPIWLDRYYYPDLLSRQKALKEQPNLKKTLGSIIDKNYIDIEEHVEAGSEENHELNDLIAKGKETKELIVKNTFFDKISDMVIEPGCKYKFSHLSKDMISDVIFNTSFDRINLIENNYGNPVTIGDYLSFNGVNYRKIDYSKWNKTNAINFNTDLYIDPQYKMGIQLFGTDYCTGFNIQNRKDLAPLHYYSSERTIYLFDDNFSVSRKFPMYDKYKEKIKKMVLGDVFDDVIVMTSEAIYFLSYDLKVKARIEYTALYRDKQFVPSEIADEVRNNKLAEIFCKFQPTFYKNNLYIPYIQSILKLVLVPENDTDISVDNKMRSKDTSYPAAIRLLNDDEYYVTYNKTDDSNDSTEQIDWKTADFEQYDGVENGFINVKCLIKHIYIDKDDNIYGLNFDRYSIATDCDTMYGLYNSEEDMAQGGWSWIYNVRLSKIRARLGTSKYAEFGSPNSIDHISFNLNGEMGLIRSFRSALWNTNSDNIKRMEIYDRTKRLIYTIDMRNYSKVYSFNSYNYITQSGEERTVFVAIADRFNGTSNTAQLYKVMYISNFNGTDKAEEEYIADCRELPASEPFDIVNSNAIMRYNNTNKLYFNLYLPTINMYNRALTIEWDISDVQAGWYNINVAIDLKKAIFELRINDTIYSIINSENNSLFIKNVNADGIIFNTTYYIGCIGKQYGTTLNDVLSSNIYDPYICKNCRIENMSIYTKTLSYYEYQAMRLLGKPLYPLHLTLPCGTRNNLEEIVRYFKYTYPGSVSNKVKINISGTGLTNEGEFEILRNEILTALQNETDCLVDINDIEFI